MKKKVLWLAMAGAALAGIVGCATANKEKPIAPSTEQADTEEAPEEEAAQETAKEDVDEGGNSNGNQNNAEEPEETGEELEGEETFEESMENYVTYYGCPNSKRVVALNTKKNRMRL